MMGTQAQLYAKLGDTIEALKRCLDDSLYSLASLSVVQFTRDLPIYALFKKTYYLLHKADFHLSEKFCIVRI